MIVKNPVTEHSRKDGFISRELAWFSNLEVAKSEEFILKCCDIEGNFPRAGRTCFDTKGEQRDMPRLTVLNPNPPGIWKTGSQGITFPRIHLSILYQHVATIENRENILDIQWGMVGDGVIDKYLF